MGLLINTQERVTNMELKKKKSSNWIILFVIPILVISSVGFIAGFVWMYLISGVKNGQNYMTKLSGYETNEEMMDRMIAEQLAKPTKEGA